MFWENVSVALATQKVAFDFFLNFPSFAPVKVSEIDITDSLAYSKGKTQLIRLQDQFGGSDIVLDLTNIEMDIRFGHINKHINGPNDDLGSAFLGVILVGIPVFVLASPILFVNYLAWKLVERMSGMNRHSFVFFYKIKNQLSIETAENIRQALIKLSQNV